LDEALKELEIKEIILIGIATEYCVRNTAEDLIKAGYRVFVKEDCLACVEPEDHKKAIAEMKAKGISFI
jgi:nicotinamidase/pyrazinamidase